MSDTTHRNYPLVDIGQPQTEGAARINAALTHIDADVAALQGDLARKAGAQSVKDLEAAVQAARDKIDVLLAGGLSADKVNETVTRLFLTADERAEIAKLRTDLKSAESKLAVHYRWRWDTIREDTTVWAYEGETYLVSPGANLLFPSGPKDSSTIGIVTVGDVKAKPIKISLYGHPFEGSTEPVMIGRTVSLMLEYREGEWRIAP